MASKSLTFELFGADRSASSALAGVARQGQMMGTALAGAAAAGAVALAAAGAAAVNFAGDSVKAFAEAEQAQNRLAFAYEKYPALVGGNVAELQKLNSELQKTTRFEDDAVAAAQGQLAMYDLSADQLKELTPLMLDYAAATGKDAGEAAEDLGKAILGQGRALKSVGLNFTDAGDPLLNYTQLVEGLRTQVQGFAEQDADSVAGKLDQIQNKFGDIQERIGEAFLPTFNVIANAVDETLLPAINNALNSAQFAKFSEDLGPAVESLVLLGSEALPDIVDGLAAVAEGVPPALEALEGLWNFISNGDLGPAAGGFSIGDWFDDVRASIDEFHGVGEESVDAFIAGTEAKRPAVLDQWNSLFVIPETEEPFNSGTNFAIGFANGISVEIPRVIVTAKGMAQAANDAVRDTLRQRSPSKVMQYAGQMFSEGFALGITDGTGQAEVAAHELARAAMIPDLTSGWNGAAAQPGAGSLSNKVGSALTGGLQVTVNLTGIYGGTDDDLAKTVTRAIADSIKRGNIPRGWNSTG